MLKIIKYKKYKDNKYIVTFSNEEVLLYDDIVLKYELLLKKSILEEELNRIKEENQKLQSYYDSLKYLNQKMRTKKEVEDFLHKKGYSKEQTIETINRLENEKWLNDEYYLEIYLKDALNLTLDGPNKIKRKLQALGIKEEIITNSLNNIDESIWQEKIKKILMKKNSQTHKESKIMWENKVLQYCLNQGFLKEQVMEELKHITYQQDPNSLEREKDKLMKKLSLKYSGDNLKWQVKQRLRQRGYIREEIESLKW